MNTQPIASLKPVAEDPIQYQHTFNTEFLAEVSFGTVPGYSSVYVLGHNPTVDSGTVPEDVWNGGNTYNWISSVSNLEIISTSINDSYTGTAARTVTINGLDANYKQVSETVQLTGNVATPISTQFFRINNAIVSSVGNSAVGTNQGSLTIRDVSGGTIRAYIDAEHGITQSAVYTVPKNHQYQMRTLFASLARNGGTANYFSIVLNYRPANGVTYRPFEFGYDGNPVELGDLPGIVFPEKTDIWLSVVYTSGNSFNITAGWNGFLKRTDPD